MLAEAESDRDQPPLRDLQLDAAIRMPPIAIANSSVDSGNSSTARYWNGLCTTSPCRAPTALVTVSATSEYVSGDAGSAQRRRDDRGDERGGRVDREEQDDRQVALDVGVAVLGERGRSRDEQERDEQVQRARDHHQAERGHRGPHPPVGEVAGGQADQHRAGDRKPARRWLHGRRGRVPGRSWKTSRARARCWPRRPDRTRRIRSSRDPRRNAWRRRPAPPRRRRPP